MYTGIKFKVILTKRPLVNKKIPTLLKWYKLMVELGMCPYNGIGYSGNFSFRTKKGFIITPSAACELTAKDLVHVTEINKKLFRVRATGLRTPSSETFLHGMIYEKRKDVNAIFHGHSKKLMKRKGLPCTKKFRPYGTVELAEEVLDTLANYSFILIKSHGWLSVGKTMDEAGKNVPGKLLK